MKFKKDYVYLVYCNKNPKVYAVYKKKQKAVRYALGLIRYRKNKAKQNNWNFSYNHFHPLQSKSQIYWSKNDPLIAEDTIFSSCLSIKDNLNSEWSDNNCWIKIDRKFLR